MKTLAEIIGENIRARREAKGMTMYGLNKAVKGGTGRDCALVIAWESGKWVPSVHYLMALADALECSMDELVGRK